MRGVNLAEVKEWMGHADIATTMRYAHLAPGRLKEAARVLDLPAPQQVGATGFLHAPPGLALEAGLLATTFAAPWEAKKWAFSGAGLRATSLLR